MNEVSKKTDKTLIDVNQYANGIYIYKITFEIDKYSLKS